MSANIQIDFEPVGKRGRLSAGESVLGHARQLGVDIVNICGGSGTCGHCKVQIISGDTSLPTAIEHEAFGSEELAEGYRLACQTIPLSDCVIHVPPESLTSLLLCDE